MAKKLVSRPNLEHLRTQAKKLLVELRQGSKEAITYIQAHFPTATVLSADEVKQRDWRLADAQLAVARQTGFASWPKLSAHVETLRSLEGTWEFENLEVAGNSVAPEMLHGSRILIDGDRFRSESSGSIYEGIFIIDVEPKIYTIDIQFVEGPEAGNTNYGIFRFANSRLEICLDMYGKARPTKFATVAGTGQALEKLVRSDATCPQNVTGGTPPTGQQEPDTQGFVEHIGYVPGDMIQRVQGEWISVKMVSDGMALPVGMVKSGKRVANQNRLSVTFGGQTMIDALFRIDETKEPIAVDYLHVSGGLAGKLQLGIIVLEGDQLIVNMAAFGRPRPENFECAKGSMQTLSYWKLKELP
ncbi:MAG: TIGR03067 domain-containing protein [Pirellulales bacterium]